jgi:hypothetical protein
MRLLRDASFLDAYAQRTHQFLTCTLRVFFYASGPDEYAQRTHRVCSGYATVNDAYAQDVLKGPFQMSYVL